MKYRPIFLGGLILGGSSSEEHPTDDQLKALLGTLAPRILDIQSVAVKYSSTPFRGAAGPESIRPLPQRGRPIANDLSLPTSAADVLCDSWA